MGDIFVTAILAIITFQALASIHKPRTSDDYQNSPQRSRRARTELAKLQLYRGCPKCGESVRRTAAFCRFCGHEFDPATIVTTKTVVLASVGDLKIDMIRLIRKEAKLGLQEAKELIEAVPTVFAKDVSLGEATRLKTVFEQTGAAVVIV